MTNESETRKQLGELLAVLNRDGGQYQAEHGTVAAVKKGIDNFLNAINMRDEWERRAYRIYTHDCPISEAVGWFMQEGSVEPETDTK